MRVRSRRWTGLRLAAARTLYRGRPRPAHRSQNLARKVVSSAKMLSDANAFEICDIQEDDPRGANDAISRAPRP